MNLLLPDFLAISLLVGVLVSFRGKIQGRDGMRLWVAGLMLILLEGAARIIYVLPGNPQFTHRLSHTVALVSYLLAGVLFLLSASPRLRAVPRCGWIASVNTLPLVAMLSVYGWDVRVLTPYLWCVAAGVVCGIVSCLFLRAGWKGYVVAATIWLPTILALFERQYRMATYASLAILYLLSAFAFGITLPKGSRGKFAVVTGFTVWALCFATHPFTDHAHPMWEQFSDQIWSMQKFVITVGLLLVMLEEQWKSSEWLALHDPLTSLPNRRYFDQHLQNALVQAERQGVRVYLFALDLNGFKHINDTFGHLAGDAVLRQISQNLMQVGRDRGVWARLGGDEFSFILNPTASPLEQTEIAALKQRIAEAVQLPVTLGPTHPHESGSISTSVGIAVYPDDATDASTLMRLSDMRMYSEKAMQSERQPEMATDHAAPAVGAR